MARKKTGQPSPAEDNLLYGIHSIEAVLATHPERLLNLFVLSKGRNTTNPRLKAIIQQAQQHGINCQAVNQTQIEKKIGAVNHQGVAGEYRPALAQDENALNELLETDQPLCILVLDCITDPHNLGACIRSAEALGANALVIPKDKSVSLNSTVRRVASGAAEILPVFQVTNLARTLEHMKTLGCWVLGAACDVQAVELQAVQFPKKHAMVLGNEGTGLRTLTQKCCDQLVQIPMPGYLNSLNVSVATGIFLFASLTSATAQSAETQGTTA